MKRSLVRVRPSCEAAVEEALHYRPLIVKTMHESIEAADEAPPCTLTIDRGFPGASIRLDFHAKPQRKSGLAMKTAGV